MYKRWLVGDEGEGGERRGSVVVQEGEELIGFAALNISALSLQVRASQSFMIRRGFGCPAEF